MGAGQSSQDAGKPAIKVSYYALLGVERESSEDEIKRAYRRKALELHPDRNYGKEEEATRQFADIQAAYEILSDPQERAWYDSHEGAILRGFEGGEDGSAGDAYQYGDIKITTSDDVSRFVAGFAMRRVDYENVPDKFFTELNTFFAKLADEESRAARMEGLEDPEYSSFGDKNDAYDDVVKAFYASWNGFSTSKSYFWVDKWNLTEAPDRRYRRAMEKENKKEREDAIREFNDSVRTLVGFVRKRDPRYLPNFQTDSDRQQALRDAAQAQALRSRKANALQTSTGEDAVPAWAKVRPADEEEETESEEEVIEEIECVACRKSFRSEKQYEAHEKSKKHQKAVQSLKKQMRKDNDMLDLLDDDLLSPPAISPDGDGEQAPHFNVPAVDEDDELENIADGVAFVTIDKDHISNRHVASDFASETDSSDAVDAGNEAVVSSETTADKVLQTLDEEKASQPSTPKIGKAAQKRAKKAAKANEVDANAKFTCAACNAAFPSKTRLFQHIKDFGHAAPQSTIKAGKGKKAKK